MLVTITSDASYSNQQGTAGYAFLISSNLGRFHKSGTLNVETITEAELMAIGNALYYVLHHKGIYNVSKIILNVDFIAAKEMIFKKGGTKAMRGDSGEKYRKIVKVIKQIIESLKKQGCKEISFKHVKSHSKVGDTRSKANEFVDKLAVKARKNSAL